MPPIAEDLGENQNEPKRPQSGCRLGSFWCSTWPSVDKGTDYNLHHVLKLVERSEAQSAPLTSVHGVDYNQCLCLLKAELKTKTNPNGHQSVAVWVRFAVQLN